MPSDPKPVEPGPPTCRRCGKRLQLTPLGWGEPSIDAFNVANGVPYCQSCLLARLQTPIDV